MRNAAILLLIVGGAALVGVPAVLRADDPPAQPPAQPPAGEKPKRESPKPPTDTSNDPNEILRRLKEEAAKGGTELRDAPAHPAKPEAPKQASPAALTPPNQQNAPGHGVNEDAGKKADAVQMKAEADKRKAAQAAAAAAAQQAPQPGARPPGAGPAAAPGQIQIPGGAPAAPAAPAAASVAPPGNQPPPPFPPAGDDTFTFNFSEPVDLTILVNLVRDALGIQIVPMDGGLAGQKVFLNQPVTIKRSEVMNFLVMLLEQKEYTIVQDATGLYIVQPRNAIQPNLAAPGQSDKYATTRIIPTPNIKPSSLQTAVTSLINTNRSGGAPASQPVFLDDLGVIILTESPRVSGLVDQFVKELVDKRAQIRFQRYELQNISAASARDRVLELLGQQGQRPAGAAPGQPAVPGAAVSTITNLSERLSVDPSSNALFFRGRPDEGEFLADLLQIVDVPNGLVSRWYPVGNSTAEAVASAGRAEQLGNVTTFESSSGGQSRGGSTGVRTGSPQGGGAQAETAGAGFVLYPEAGGFIYRGTESQHHRVEALVASLKDLSERDRMVYEFYRLRHGKAADVAEIIQNLLSNSLPTGNRGGLVGRDLGSRSGQRTLPNGTTVPIPPALANQANQPNQPAGADAAGGLGEIAGEEVFVLADEKNNQVVVKAPVRLQPQFRQLINRIDLRRPQVYIDTKIVSVSSQKDFRLAIEAQQIIGQFAFNTNFGLSTLATAGQPITEPKTIPGTLQGITAAIIRSKDVPIVINAFARDIDGRIVATPQLLVDDNEEAEVSSLDQQPTTTTSQGTSTTQSSFGGYEPAGPKLKVKPQIAEGGYLRLEYEVELSAFVGDSSSPGVPPAKQEAKISSKSVTVPADTTIVVGGLTQELTTSTVLKVPFLGDIPLVGYLFRDTRKNSRQTTLYFFITPKVMRDPSFADLRLLTKAPLALSKIPAETPPPEATRIDVLDTAYADTAYRQEKSAEVNKPLPQIDPSKVDPKRPPPGEPVSPTDPQSKTTPVRKKPPQQQQPQ